MTQSYWWQRDDLCYRDGKLTYCNKNVETLADALDTPLYLYSAARIRSNLTSLHEALEQNEVRHTIYYAMKANRFAPLLTYLKVTGLCGIDACSPAEVKLALSCGFAQHEISYTATSMSDQDADQLAQWPEMLINCDSISAIKKIGKRCPGRSIGLRINPARGVGYHNLSALQYSGKKATKFGIYREHFEEALAVAKDYRLAVHRIHFHTGCGYLNDQLHQLEEIFEAATWFTARIPELHQVNLGGGLGVPHTESDPQLDLRAWGKLVQKYFGSHHVAIEPGDYIVKDSGLLLLEVASVERKQDTLFVGVNGGFNLAVEPVFYQRPKEAVLCKQPATSALLETTIAGNINEALDIWAERIPFPQCEEGQRIVFLNAGGYASSMSSNHCLRGQFSEYLLFDKE